MTRYKFLSFAVSLTLVIVAGIATLAGQQRGAAAAPAGQAPAAPPARQAGHGMGKLVIWGDLSLFEPRGHPQSCWLMNRFKRGQPAGFRMTAVDGGTGEVENTAVLVIHVTYGGRTDDIPMRFRGAAGPNAPPPQGYLAAPVELWTGKWVVPGDAPIGAVAYTVTATDAFGRTATFKPFSYSTSQLTVVE